MKTFEEFLLEYSDDGSFSSDYVIEYIKGNTPNESDLPDYFLSLIAKSRKRFKRMEVDIDEVLEKDPSVKEYVESGEDRYKDEEPDNNDLYYPIVIFEDKVMDGYSRIAALHRMGEKTITAYVSIR